MNWLDKGVDAARAKKGRPPLAAQEIVTATDIDQVVKSLERAGQVRDDLGKVVAGVKVMAHSGLTLEALALLVHAKCEWGANRKEIPLSTVEKVIKALLKLDEHLVRR